MWCCDLSMENFTTSLTTHNVKALSLLKLGFGHGQVLEGLLDDDEDMEQMYLSRKVRQREAEALQQATEEKEDDFSDVGTIPEEDEEIEEDEDFPPSRVETDIHTEPVETPFLKSTHQSKGTSALKSRLGQNYIHSTNSSLILTLQILVNRTWSLILLETHLALSTENFLWAMTFAYVIESVWKVAKSHSMWKIYCSLECCFPPIQHASFTLSSSPSKHTLSAIYTISQELNVLIHPDFGYYYDWNDSTKNTLRLFNTLNWSCRDMRENIEQLFRWCFTLWDQFCVFRVGHSEF